MSTVNRQITLAARPVGFPQESDFELVEAPVPQPADGELLVRTLYLSVDPYMRGRMSQARSYADPLEIGDVMVGEIVGAVESSRNPRFDEGDIVAAMLGWQQYALSDGTGVRKVKAGDQPISTALHVLGMPGLTAYFGLLDVCEVHEGDEVVVSAAAGAVGSIVGQIAKLKGCRVVGIAGSDEKIAFITEELGFDAGLDYKSTDDYYAALKELCPRGIDVYFDNVGGPITDAVFRLLNVGARIGICGQISQYNLEKPELGPRLLVHLLVKCAKVEGFLVFRFADRYREGIDALSEWVASGRIRYREQVAEGIENAPAAFIGMLKGANIGKQLVKVSEL